MTSFTEFPYIGKDGGRGKTPIINFDPIPVPVAGIFDSPSVNVCLNSAWASIIIARLIQLTRPGAWIGNETEQIAAASQMMEFLANMDCEDCANYITDIRTADDGTLQVKRAGAWTNASGDGGDTTVINNQETTVTNVYPPAPIDEETVSMERRSCGIATGLANYFYERMGDLLDAIDAEFSIIAAVDVFLAVAYPLYFVVNEITNAARQIEQATTGLIRAGDTQGKREEAICAIYEYLIQNGGYVTPDNAGAVRSAFLGTISAPIYPIWLIFLEAFTDAGVAHRASLYQDQDGICAGLCESALSCSQFQSSGAGGYIISSGTLVTGQCNGTPGVYNSGSGTTYLIWESPSSQIAFIESVKAKHSYGNAASANVQQLIRNNGNLIQQLQSYSGPVSATTCTPTAYDPNKFGDKVELYATSDGAYTFSEVEICYRLGWEHTFDFTISNQGFTHYPESEGIANPAGAWSVLGWASQFVDGANRMRINKAINTPSSILYAQIFFTPSPWNPSLGDPVYVSVADGAINTIPPHTEFVLSLPGVQSASPFEALNPVGVDITHRLLIDFAHDSQSFTITKLILRGVGVDPFA